MNSKLKLIYESLNHPVLDLIPGNVKILLDIGCGNGALGKYLKVRFPKLYVTGITYSEEEARFAMPGIDEVIIADLNSFHFNSLKKFDCIICSHVLEHLYEPEVLLKKIKLQLTEEGLVIIALPNILHWKQRLKFIKGSFKYTEGGLMDKTHFRFYDWKTAQALINECGFALLNKKAYGAFPLPLIRAVLPKSISDGIDQLACSLLPGLFGFQFVFSCKPNK